MKDLSFSGNSPKKAVKQRRKPKKLQDPNLDETALEQESFVSQTSNGEPLEDVIPKKAKKRTSVEVELKSDDPPLKPKKKKQKPVEVEQNDDVPPPKPKEKKQKPVEVEQKDDAPPKSKEKKQKLKQNGGPVKGILKSANFADDDTVKDRTVFVGNVPFKTKPDKLKKLFRPYGKIEAIYKRSLLQKTEKLTLKMFGTDEELKKTVTDAHIYVRYENEEDAKKAVELNGTIFEGRYLRVTLSNKNITDKHRSLFVGNLLYKTTEQALMEFFMEKIGNVEAVHIVHDKATGLGKGYGFVTFKEVDQALRALKELDGERLKGRRIRLTKVAKKKKDRPVGNPASSKRRSQEMKQQREEHTLKQKLANYVVTKKTFANAGPEKKLSKKVIKTIKKRRDKKQKKGLLS